MFFSRRLCLSLWAALLFGSAQATAQQQVLSLKSAVMLAQKDDPWLAASLHRQQAIESLAEASGVMPDPKVSVGLNNLALDSFDFSQEAMTQVKFGVSQTLPRGDSLTHARQRLQLTAEQYPFARRDRKAQVSVKVAQIWLEVFQARQSIALIEQNRELFEKLADIAQASYSSAVGKTRQQDIVRAQLELTRLDDRLAVLRQTEQVQWQNLGQWIDVGMDVSLPDEMPDLKPKGMSLPDLNKHPAFMTIARKIDAGSSAVALAKQQYKPQWTVNAGYGYRGDAPGGQDRADLFSIGVSLDIPLYTEQRQDRQVAAAVSQKEAVKTDRLLLLKRFKAQFQAAKMQYQQLLSRQHLYQAQLLQQSNEQAEAALTAYTNDDGSFSEVVRARIDQLNAQIELLAIHVSLQKTAARLNYFYVSDGNGGIL